MNQEVNIGIDNIQRIQFDKLEKDFLFIVNKKFYQTNSMVAYILSPRIAQKFDENLKLSHYEIQSKYEGDFNKIIKYGEMKPININENENEYFKDIMKQLGNNVEALRFFKEIQEDASYENVIQQIQTKKELDINLNEEIPFISSNFYDFHSKCPEEILALDVDTMEQIISNDKLQLTDEDELFDIVINLYNKSKEYSVLFSYVSFPNLSTKSIRKFAKHFDINDINGSIWKSISSRLKQNLSTESIEEYKQSHQELNNRYIGKKYEHIIQHLSEQCHGNVHTQNIVDITSSSKLENESFKAENVVEQSNNLGFGTKNENDSCIQFDFKERRVLLESYTLKTMNWPENYGHLKSWIIEVSNDGQNYIEIDRHENSDLFNGRLRTETFKVSCSTPQKFVRLKQIGPSWNGSKSLYLNQIEFSGFLKE